MKDKIMIFGCGFQGKIVQEILYDSNFEPAFFIDDNRAGTTYRELPVFSRERALSEPLRHLVIALGNDDSDKIALRQTLISAFRQTGAVFPQVIDQSARIARSARIGQGTIIHPGAIVMPDTIVEDFCVISTSASIDHDNSLAHFCNICPGVTTAGNVHIETGAFIGTGAVILPGITIGAYAVVGAGAIVTRNVDAHAVVAGNPARRIR